MIPDDDNIYSDTAFLNLTSNVWTTGPSLSTARYYHTCSLVTLDSGEKEIVVVGGYNPDQILQSTDNCTNLRSVEIINLDTNVVRAGEETSSRSYFIMVMCVFKISQYLLKRKIDFMLSTCCCRTELSLVHKITCPSVL